MRLKTDGECQLGPPACVTALRPRVSHCPAPCRVSPRCQGKMFGPFSCGLQRIRQRERVPSATACTPTIADPHVLLQTSVYILGTGGLRYEVCPVQNTLYRTLCMPDSTNRLEMLRHQTAVGTSRSSGSGTPPRRRPSPSRHGELIASSTSASAEQPVTGVPQRQREQIIRPKCGK